MRVALFSLAVLTTIGSVVQAQDTFSARYEISVGGARVMKASYGATIDENAYSAKLTVKSAGMSKWFSEISLDLATKGKVAQSALLPVIYNYTRVKNDKTRKRAAQFAATGEIITEGTKHDAAVKAALTPATLDPLTTLLRLARSENPCQGKHRSFDGRDVFDMKLSGAGSENGRITCKIVYTPVAGGDVEDGDTDSKTYEITLAPLGGGNGYIPVRITGTTKGVGLEIEAKSVEVNGKPLSN
jgi:hypothetical protein